MGQLPGFIVADVFGDDGMGKEVVQVIAVDSVWLAACLVVAKRFAYGVVGCIGRRYRMVLLEVFVKKKDALEKNVSMFCSADCFGFCVSDMILSLFA